MRYNSIMIWNKVNEKENAAKNATIHFYNLLKSYNFIPFKKTKNCEKNIILNYIIFIFNYKTKKFYFSHLYLI